MNFISIEIKKNQSSKKSVYRPEIDGLRAFAVVAVIIYHFNKEILPNGYLGVDIFFVISGFVITSSIYQRPSKNFKDFICRFYERRIRRLVPALSIFVLIFSLMVCLFNPEPGFSLVTGLTSLFGLSNQYLFQQSTDYFGQSTELNVFKHTWSIGVETQFYILFPFLIWFSGFGRQTKNGSRNLFLIVGALAITSLIGYIYLYQINEPAAFFLMPSRFWEISSGCLIFISLQKKAFYINLLEKVPPVLVLTLITVLMVLPISLKTSSTFLVVTLCAVLFASLKKETKLFTILTNPKVVYIGLISYSLYLSHWGIISISHWTIGIHWWSIPFQVVLILVLAIGSYRYIERPLRTSNYYGKRWKTFLLHAGVLITLSGVIITLGKPLKGKIFTGKKIENAKLSFLEGEKCLENLSKNRKCYLIDYKRNNTLWILGDSNAKFLALAGNKVANYLEKNLKLYTVEGTTFPPISRYQKNSKKTDLQLLKDQRLVEKELYKQIKAGDIIFLSMRMPLYFSETYDTSKKDYRFFREDGSFLSRENLLNEWILAVGNLSNIAQKKGTKVIIQTPTPEWQSEYVNRRCSQKNVQWFNRLQKRNCQIKSNFFIDEETGLYKNLLKKLNQLSNSHENIYLFDTYKVVCPKIACNFSMDDVDIYFDTNHLSYEWARDYLSPEIYKFINNMQTINN